MKRDWRILFIVFLISFLLKGLEICYAPVNSIDHFDREHVISRGDRYILMELTAYSNHFASTGKHPGDAGYGVTASNKRVRVGMIAAHSSIPFGTKLHIEGMGEFTVEDRGGDITEGRLDIYMESQEEALKFGRQKRKVQFL